MGARVIGSIHAAAGFGFTAQLERAPHIEVAETETGLLLGARRDAPAGQYYWRITQYLLPFHTMPPAEVGTDPLFHTHVWIPIDDDQLVNWCISWHPTRAITADEMTQFHAGSSIHVTDYAPATNEAYGDIRPVASRPNDYLTDWEAQRTRKFFGVPGVGAQDKAVTESQGVFDRSLERLGRAVLRPGQARSSRRAPGQARLPRPGQEREQGQRRPPPSSFPSSTSSRQPERSPRSPSEPEQPRPAVPQPPEWRLRLRPGPHPPLQQAARTCSSRPARTPMSSSES